MTTGADRRTGESPNPPPGAAPGAVPDPAPGSTREAHAEPPTGVVTGGAAVPDAMTPAPPSPEPVQEGRAEPISPLTSVRRHWALALALLVAGGVVGAGAGALVPPSYTAESRLAIGSNDLRAIAIPGYSFGAQELAASTARYLGNAQALGQLEPVLGDDAAAVESVSASPIPESSIVRVEVTAADEGTAVRATSVLTDYLVEQAASVNRSSDVEGLLEQYTELSTQVATAEVAVSTATSAAGAVLADPEALAAAEAEVARSRAELDVLRTRQSAVGARYEDAVSAQDISYELRLVADAAPSFDTASSQLQRYGLLGLAAGGLLGLVAATVVDRRRGRTPRPGTSTTP